MLPTGVMYGPRQTLTVMATGQLSDAAQFRQMVVAYHNGAPVHLGDLGNVLDDVQNNKGAAWFFNGHSLDLSVVLAVTRQPGTNTVDVTNAVKAELADIETELPHSVVVNTLYDRSVSIDRGGQRREVLAWPRALPRGARDLPVPAQPHGDDHPESRTAHGRRRARSP